MQTCKAGSQAKLELELTNMQSISNWKAFDNSTMRKDAWSSDEEHEPLPHRQGEEAETEKNASKAKAVWSTRFGTNSWSVFQGLFGDNGVAQARICTTAHHVVTGLMTQRRGLEPANALSSCIEERFRRGQRNPSGQRQDHAWIGT